MTKEELYMRKLVRESDFIDKTDESEAAKAFRYLWEKYIEQEPCDNAEMKKIDEWEIKGKNAELWIVKGNLQVRYLGTIHNIPLPLVTLQQKTGHWINLDGCEYKCSECGRIIDTNMSERDLHILYPYCHCGAKMVKLQE